MKTTLLFHILIVLFVLRNMPTREREREKLENIPHAFKFVLAFSFSLTRTNYVTREQYNIHLK